MALDRNTFIRLLGPVDEILKRNAENYDKYGKWSIFIFQFFFSKKKIYTNFSIKSIHFGTTHRLILRFFFFAFLLLQKFTVVV